MAIPFLDFNKKGNGYYTIDERKFSYLVFQFGFLELWVTLIILGTFFRGPNWNFFGPFEYWDPHKVLALNNVDLSQYFWVDVAGQALPKAPPDSGWHWQIGYILIASAPGIVAGAGYFIAAAAADGDDDLPQVLRQDGLHPLHADGQPAAVHGGVADEDGAALDAQPEVHRQPFPSTFLNF